MTTPSPSTPDAEVKPDEQNQIPPDDGASSEPEWIKIDPRNLTQEIRRLQSENHDFLNAFNTEVGNHAARKYQPQIQARERELEQERKLRRQLEILNMDEKAIEEKFEKDPVFAKEYAELVHFKPQAIADDPTPIIMEAWNETEEHARNNGVSQEFIDKVLEKAANSGYTGEGEHWSRGITRIQQDFANEIIRVKLESAKPSAPAVNDALLNKGSPDTTPASRGNAASGYTFKTVAEFKALPVSQQNEILNQPDGMKYVEEIMSKG